MVSFLYFELYCQNNFWQILLFNNVHLIIKNVSFVHLKGFSVTLCQCPKRGEPKSMEFCCENNCSFIIFWFCFITIDVLSSIVPFNCEGSTLVKNVICHRVVFWCHNGVQKASDVVNVLCLRKSNSRLNISLTKYFLNPDRLFWHGRD